MMEKKISTEVENDKYPVESLPRPAPASNDSKIGKIRIRTPAEINKEYDETPNSVSASMSEDSSDRLRELSFADFLRPPIPSPSPSVMSTVPQLMEPSAKAVKPKRKSRYPGFGQTIPPASPSVSKPKGKSRYPGFGQTIPPASHSVSKPKPKSRYRGFGESIPSQQTEPSAKVGKPNPWRFQPESSRSRENQEKVDSNFSSVDRTYSTSSSVATSFPMSSPVIRSYPAPSSVIRSYPAPSSVIGSYPAPASVTRSFLTPSKAVISYSTPVTASYPMPSSVTPSYLTPASIATSRPTKSVPNETGSGIRRNCPGFGGTTIPSPSQGNLLKEHRVTDNDAKNISASWKKLKPSLEPTDTKIPNKKQDSMSASVSKSCAARSSSSQTAEDQVGESSSNQVKQVCLSHKLPQATPILLQHFRPNPGFEKEKLYNISQPTGFNLRRENMVSTPSSFLTSANSTSSQMNRKTKYKGFTSTPVSVSQAKSVPNMPGVEGSNIRKKYPGFGEVTNSNDLQVIEKIKDKSDNKNAKNSQTRTEGRKPVKPVTVREKISSNSTYKIHELDEISKPQEEDWDSSLREWIPSEQCANVPKRKAYRGFGKITNSQNKKKRKNKPITNAGVHSNVDNTNKQQPKINRSKELEIVSHLEIQQPEAVLQQEIQQPLQVCRQQLQEQQHLSASSTFSLEHPPPTTKMVCVSYQDGNKSTPSIDVPKKEKHEKSPRGRYSEDIEQTRPDSCTLGSPSSVVNLSTESILEDLSSGFTEKMDENDNTNVQENYEVKNDYCNYDDMSTDTDTEDGGRKKLLDGVVMTISGYEDPLRGRIVRKAVEMGATYRPGWTDDCSHLVCGFIDTFKYLQAKGKGIIVQGTWIEDCYTLKKKVDWKAHILSEEKVDSKPTEEKADNELTDNVLTKDTSSKSDGLLFLAGMEVRLKDSCLFEQLAGKAAFVTGMYHDGVHVMVQGYGQLSLAPAELEHLVPERGDKAKYVMECLGENTMEVINVDEGKGMAVVRYDGYKGAVVPLTHLCRVEEI